MIFLYNSNMLKILITIPIILLLTFEMIALGKRITKSNIGFIRNEMAVFALGFVTYIVITAFIFFPFIWIRINLLYFVIIFIAKDIILIFILISNTTWGTIIKSFDYKTLISFLVSSVILVLIYHFVNAKEYSPMKVDYSASSNFFGWNWYYFKEVLARISYSSVQWVSDWILSFISSMMIYASLGAFMRKYMHLSYIAEFISTLGLSVIIVLFFHSNKHIVELVGIFVAFFSIFIIMNMIEHSRRRFGAMFGIAFVVAWLIDPQTLFVLGAISFTASLLYIYYKKPMVPLFVTLLSIPLIFAASVLLMDFWVGLPIIISVVLLSIYFAVLINSRYVLFDKIHEWSLRNSSYLFITYALAFLGVSISFIFIFKIDIFDLLVRSISLFPNGSNSQIIIGAVLYYLMVALVVVVLTLFYIYKVKIVRIKLAFIFISLILAIFFNPLMYAITLPSLLEQGFEYLKFIIYLPLIALSISSVVNFTIELLRFQKIDFSDKISSLKFFRKRSNIE